MITHLFNYSDQAVGITMAALTCVMSPVSPVVNQTKPLKLLKPKVSNISWSLHKNGFLKNPKMFCFYVLHGFTILCRFNCNFTRNLPALRIRSKVTCIHIHNTY